MADEQTPTPSPVEESGNQDTPKAIEFTPEQQAKVDEIIKARLEREQAKREKAEATAREEAKAKSLEEQQEYKQLAEQRAARVEELEPYQAKAERYEAALNAQLDTEIKLVPPHVKDLLDRLDVAEQLEYIAQHKEQWARKAPPNINDAPSSVGASLSDEEQEQRLRQRFPSLRG